MVESKIRLRSGKVLSLASAHLPRSTLQEHVYERLSSLILTGEIAPGQLITVQALSDAFGVSAMPIREALQKLIGANALTVIAGRSIGIPPLTAERLLDISRVRRELEGAAAAWAARQVSAADIDGLEQLLPEMLEAVRKQDAKAFLRANREFHFTIYRLSKSNTAYRIIETLWLQIAPYFHHLYELDSYSKANTEHRVILDALKAGDAKAARRGIQADIDTGCELLLKMLAQEEVGAERQ